MLVGIKCDISYLFCYLLTFGVCAIDSHLKLGQVGKYFPLSIVTERWKSGMLICNGTQNRYCSFICVCISTQ